MALILSANSVSRSTSRSCRCLSLPYYRRRRDPVVSPYFDSLRTSARPSLSRRSSLRVYPLPWYLQMSLQFLCHFQRKTLRSYWCLYPCRYLRLTLDSVHPDCHYRKSFFIRSLRWAATYPTVTATLQMSIRSSECLRESSQLSSFLNVVSLTLLSSFQLLFTL